MTNYLGEHYDPGLDISGIGSREDLEKKQINRINRELAVILVTASIPRRLGPDADETELALDKKRGRRVAHALHQALTGWTKRPPQVTLDDEIRRLGAQLNWTSWQPAVLRSIEEQRRCVATYAVRSGQERWGKSAIVRLNNELKWVEYALR
jgi:hypothetical protein